MISKQLFRIVIKSCRVSFPWKNKTLLKKRKEKQLKHKDKQTYIHVLYNFVKKNSGLGDERRAGCNTKCVKTS